MTDAWLVDTNVLLRWAFAEHPDHPTAFDAVRAVQEGGGLACATPQNLVEFWNSATRPAEQNGFGQTPAWADEALDRIERYFFVLDDAPSVYRVWRRIVRERAVSGVKVHDARLVAFMEVYDIPRILTFNARDFHRYPALKAVNPQEIAETG